MRWPGVSEAFSFAQFKSAKISIKDKVRYPVTHLHSAIIGIIVGIVPGTGGDIASYVAHNVGKMLAKRKTSDMAPVRGGLLCVR